MSVSDSTLGRSQLMGSRPTLPLNTTTHDNSESKTLGDTMENHLETHHIPCFCKPLPSQTFGRNLVVTIDGTSNQFGVKNTNIVELYSRLVKDETQLTYYNSGIGTYVADSISIDSVKQYMSHQWDKAFAANLKTRILKAYAWLSENYRLGDRIFLFGFSRGAYQVRVIAGMIEKVGLLHKGNTEQIPFAYDLYTATLKRGGGKGKAHEDAGTSKKQASCGEANSTPEQLCRQFKKSLSNDKVAVHFVGSWDTVSSVGVLKGENLPETTNGMKHVCAFRHALALDELRVKFLPEYANGGEGPPPPPQASQSSDTFNPFHNTKSTTQGRKHGGNIKEVWFAGSHSDVGGGIAENLENNSFGPSLRWMTYEAILWGLRMNPFHNKWVLPTSISSMDWRWNVLEVLPISHLSYKNSVAVTRIPHLKSPRQIKPGQRIHESVFELIDRKPKYRPKAKLPEGFNGWKKEQLEAYIEVDPYIQPNKILDAIQGNEEGVDYDGLLNLSKTEIGIMAIRERQEAESILATALVNESRKSHSTERNARVATISKILDKCFDIIPVEFLTDENPEPPPSAWAILDTLYPEPSPARSKFLHRFADRNTRLEQTEKEIEKYSKALETGSGASKRVRLGYVKKLVVGLLDLLVLTTPHIDGTYKAALHDLYKKALRFPELSYSDRSALIKSMANGINKNYDIGLEGFLDERISLTKSLFKLTPPENASRDDYLHDLLPTLYQRFEETSQPKDIDEILSFNSEILDLLSASQTHAGAISLACTLASSYMAQFKLTGQFTHVDEALLHLQGGILSSRPSDPDRADLLDIQGNWFHLHYKETGQSSYLDQADQSYRRAREIRHSFDASIHPLNREAAVLCDRFKLTRQQSDLNKAIELHRQALPLLSKQPRQLSLASFDFADTLLTLFNETGLTIHLDEAIELYEQALELNPAPRFPRAKCLNGLGVALRKRFEISGKDEVISKSIDLHEEALKLCPEPYIERDDCFSGLASALAKRYMKFGEQSDLKAALNSYLSALDLLSSSHPKRATLLFGLATTIRIFLENTKQEEKLEGVIPYYREALELLPLTHVDRADSLFGLAVALKTLHVQRSLNPHKFHTVANKSETILDDILPLYSEPNSSGLVSKNWLDYLPIPNIFSSTNLKAPSMSSRASQPNMRERAQIDSPREKPRRSSHPSHGDSPTRLLSMANIHAPKHRLSASSLQSDAVSAISMAHGQYEELDEAINLLKESLQLRPPTHPARIESLRCIVDAFTIRFGAVGHPDVDSYRRELNALEYGFKHPNPSEAI